MKVNEFIEDLGALCRQYWGIKYDINHITGTEFVNANHKIELLFDDVLNQDEIKEAWSYIDGYGTDYLVSNLGRIVSRKREPIIFMSQQISSWGYKSVVLTKNGIPKTKIVHRLVAFAFIGKPPSESYEVNHKDGKKTNNRVDNLEWVLAMDNMKHAMENGLLTKKIYLMAFEMPLDLKAKAKKQAEKEGLKLSPWIYKVIKKELNL